MGTLIKLEEKNTREKLRLDQCFSIQQGKQVSKNNRVGDNQKPFLRTANVFWRRLDLTTLDTMNFSTSEEEKLRLVKGDLLLCEGGDIGRTAMWNNEIDGCYYQNHLHRLRKINKNVDENYILFYLHYAFVYAKLYTGRGNVTTIPNLSKSRLSELEVLVPTLLEQQKIVKILTTLQETISIQEELLLKLKVLKQSMMHHLFTHGTKGEPTKITEIGEMPESWEIKRLGDLSKIMGSGITFSQAEKIKGQYTVSGIKVSDMNLRGNKKYIKNTQTTFYFSNVSKVVPSQSLIFPKRGAAIATNKKRITTQYSLLDPNLIAVVTNSLISPDFMYYFFETIDLKKLTDTGTIPQLNKKDLLPLRIVVPTTEEQSLIVKILEVVDKKTEINEERLSEYEILFKTLLHELMSGERKIN